jgi:hypothetical protein
MVSWKKAFSNALLTGGAASVLSTIALSVCGLIEKRSAAGPSNAPSQWIWGERHGYRRRFSLRYTGVGYLVHHTMSTGWAVLHEKTFAERREKAAVPERLAYCAITAAVACFADYQIARGRFQPGFEKHLSRTSLFAVYAAFAFGLFAGGELTQVISRHRRARPPEQHVRRVVVRNRIHPHRDPLR